MSIKEFANFDDKALKDEVLALKKELFNLNMNRSSMHIKDYSQFKKLRVRIAQAKTVFNMRRKAGLTQQG